ncbi:MAG: hypothetical protein ACW99G_22815 [Candidatus Thorarchaeota archaeon]|jgi:hypothetical protein
MTNKPSGPVVFMTRITDENRPALLRFALSFYLGEPCPFCGVVFKTIEDLDDSVWCPNRDGRIAHGKCLDKAIDEL